MNPSLLLCLLLTLASLAGCSADPAPGPQPDLGTAVDLAPPVAAVDLAPPAQDLGVPADLVVGPCCQQDAMATCHPIPCGGDR